MRRTRPQEEEGHYCYHDDGDDAEQQQQHHHQVGQQRDRKYRCLVVSRRAATTRLSSSSSSSWLVSSFVLFLVTVATAPCYCSAQERRQQYREHLDKARQRQRRQQQESTDAAGSGSATSAAGGDGGGTNLEGGIVTRVPVKEYADLALDVRDVRLYADQDQAEAALSLYGKGFHSELQQPGAVFSLSQLSTDLANAMTTNTPNSKSSDAATPYYLFQLLGLADLDYDEIAQHAHYADAFVRSSLSTNLALVPDAVVVLNMWMYATHLLMEGIRVCAERTAAADPAFIPLTLKGGGMDEFIALWIGTDQTPATDDGHVLYAWAHAAGDLFGTTQPEAAVNSKIKLLYQQGAAALAMPNACTADNTKTVEQLWNVATQMQKEMMKPLFQYLLFYLSERDASGVLLYATAVVPQLSVCRSSLYKRLRESLMGGENSVDFSKTTEIVHDLYQAMMCFGFTCNDVGKYDGMPDDTMQCDASIIMTEDEGQVPLAGYVPTSGTVDMARIDLDILQLEVLVRLSAYPYTKLLYQYGANVPTPRDSPNDVFSWTSLSRLATSTTRTAAGDAYDAFLSYFNDKNYADTAMLAAILPAAAEGSTADYKWKTSAQRAAVVRLTAAFQIVHLQVLAHLHDAVAACRDADPTSLPNLVAGPSLTAWDTAAGLLIGSLEGIVPAAGSLDYEDGRLLFNLANTRAFAFGTLVEDEGYSTTSNAVLDLLYAGKGELGALDCTNLEITAHEIQRLAMIPMIQSTLRAAMETQKIKENPLGSASAHLTEGEVFALSMLPMMQHDAATAELVRENMVVQAGVPPVRDGMELLGDAMGFFVTDTLQLPCGTFLGGTAEVQPCRHYGGASADHSSASTKLSTAVVAVVLGGGGLLLLWSTM